MAFKANLDEADMETWDRDSHNDEQKSFDITKFDETQKNIWLKTLNILVIWYKGVNCTL